MIACLACQIGEKDPLGASIAFPERVQDIDLAQIVGGTAGKDIGRHASQMLLLCQAREECSRLIPNVGEMREVRSAFTYINLAEFSSPVVDILEQIAMNRLQMR